MTGEQVLDRLSELAAEHFNSPGLRLRRETTAADVEGWDSVSHLQFLMRIEEDLGIRFKTAEVSGIANVGELAERVTRHLR